LPIPVGGVRAVAGHALQGVSETLEPINFVWRCIGLAAAASLSPSRRVFILCDSFGRRDRLAAATSFRRTVKLWRFPAPLPGYNCLSAAASFPLSRKISRLCGSFGHVMTALRLPLRTVGIVKLRFFSTQFRVTTALRLLYRFD